MLKKIAKNILFWRIGILIISALAMALIPFKYSFPYAEQLLEPSGSPLFWSLANFDGVHYLGIATKGYFADFTQAFFPLYPLLMRWLNLIFNNLILTGYIISLGCLGGFLWFLYKLIKLDHGQQVANNSLVFYLLFPTSFFFTALYTESLFMLLVIASFYLSRQKKWLLAGILGALASATRLFGILLLPALLIEFWLQNKKQKPIKLIKKSLPQIAAISLAAIGLLLYMRYLAAHFSDALYFLHAQPAFGAQRSADKLILIYQVFWRYSKMMVTVKFPSLLYYTVAQEYLISLVFLVLSLISLKKIRLSYSIFGISAYLLPTLTGTLSSMPRYVLAIFPAFILLGKIKQTKVRNLLLILSCLLLAINLSLFTRGYWVA